jgi:tetratricopeptide (TPR) repeat protein
MNMAAVHRTGRPGWIGIAATISLSAVLLTAALGLQTVRQRHYTVSTAGTEVLYLRSGTAASRLALAYTALAADVYWIRAIQHYGDTRRSASPDKPYALLAPLLDLTTTLDSRFTVAYRFGAIFLAESYPDGPGRPDLAIALLKKGLAAEPEKWVYAQDAGFVYYWWLHDYKNAAAWFDRASSIAGAPWWLRSMAATTLTQGGDRRSSRLLWRQLYETAEDTWVTNNARLKLAQLDALDDIDSLAGLVRRFTLAAGRPPSAWSDLVALRWLPGVPTDPAGKPYQLDLSAPGGVTVSRRSPLFPLPSQFGSTTGPPS